MQPFGSHMGLGRGPAACEGTGHVLETPRHQWDRQPGKMGFQVLFSAAWLINIKIYNLLWGEIGVLCVSPAGFVWTFSSFLNF